MKKNKLHIIYARLLLIIFIAGQVILYGHQHHSSYVPEKARSSSQQTVKEKCQLCDAMQVNHSVIDQQLHIAPAPPIDQLYYHFAYSFISLKLVRSAGRSPPIA